MHVILKEGRAHPLSPTLYPNYNQKMQLKLPELGKMSVEKPDLQTLGGSIYSYSSLNAGPGCVLHAYDTS